MPELPEVETVVRTLRPQLVDRQVTAVTLGPQRLRRDWDPRLPSLAGQSIRSLHRRGKWIIVDLSPVQLLVHLGMTGQFTVGPRDREVMPHTHCSFDLVKRQQLRFRDPRRFGSIDYFSTADELTAFLNERLGPEPWDVPSPSWRSALVATPRAIKAVLLDQAIIAGIGNIYADEALFEARIHPATPANRLTRPKAEQLRQCILAVLETAISHRGSSIRDYLDGQGERGSFQDEFQVYGRTGLPCRKCATPIESMRLAGRTSHFCPRCQKR